MGSHYIPVGKIKIDKDILDIVCPAAGYDSTPPPPEIYCPASGYIPDPTIYVEDPVISEAVRPEEGKIRLIVTDSNSRHIQFRCTVSNSGKYVITITGANDTVLSTTTINNNSVFSTFVPLGEGYPATEYTWYYVDIAAELISNDLLSFVQTINATYDPNGGYIIAAYFNAPTLISLQAMFKNMMRIKYIEFVSNANALITLYEACYNARSLEKFVFPAEMTALTTLSYGWYNAISLKEINLNEVSVPLLESMNSFMVNTGLKTFTFPKSIDAVQTLRDGLSGNQNLENVTLYESANALEYIDGLFNGCVKLKGSIIYPEMPNLKDFEYIHKDNYEVEEIEFAGTYDNETILTEGREMFYNCKKAKKIKFPEIVYMSNNYFNSIYGCEELEYLILPKKWLSTRNYQSNTPYKAFFLSFLTNPKIKEISKVEETNLEFFFAPTINLSNLSYLESFDQPNIRLGETLSATSTVICNNYSSTRSLLSFIDLNFNGKILNSLNISNTSISLSCLLYIISKPRTADTTIYTNIIKDNCPAGDAITPIFGTLRNALTITSAIVPSTGDYIHSRSISFEIPISVDSGNSTITATNNLIFQNGTKVSFWGTVENETDSGVVFGNIYYLVNVLGTQFQISETLGGSPVSILKNFLASMNAELIVQSVSSNVVDINVTRPSANLPLTFGNFSTINFLLAHKNGWRFS